MAEPASAAELAVISAGIRAWVLAANKHPGGSSSAVEAITALYFSGATTVPDSGDRVIYSKGHAAAPWYFALWAAGGFPGITWRELAGFGQLRHPLPRMPQRDATTGIEMSAGALGQGLSFGVGAAIADRRQARPARTFVVLGDGECTEGQVWEAAMTATRLGLRNLVALVDANGSGSVIDLPRETWADRWSGFGWQADEVDGHDPAAIAALLRDSQTAVRPVAIILRTIKGKGLLPPAEGSNSLSGEADPASIPSQDVSALVEAALAVIDTRYPRLAARRSARRPHQDHPPAARPSREAILARLRGYPIGAAPVAKKTLGADLAAELAGLPVLWMAPDAIRNSGLLERMNAVGSWNWASPDSDVLQCAIAEQDAASLAAGAASAGLWPALFSMEGFYWRMLDQIRQSVAFTGLPVLLVGTSGGIGDPLGPMVQSDGCLSALAAIGGLDLYEASDINTAKLLAAEALAAGRPAYLRLPHEAVQVRRELGTLAGLPLDTGAWTLRDCDRPQVVIAAAGAMREAALQAADLLAARRGPRVRVLEIVSLSRFAALPGAQRDELIPPTALAASIHNAPSAALRAVLPPGAVTLGADSYGLSGYPLTALYDSAGLTAAALGDAISKELA